MLAKSFFKTLPRFFLFSFFLIDSVDTALAKEVEHKESPRIEHAQQASVEVKKRKRSLWGKFKDKTVGRKSATHKKRLIQRYQTEWNQGGSEALGAFWRHLDTRDRKLIKGHATTHHASGQMVTFINSLPLTGALPQASSQPFVRSETGETAPNYKTETSRETPEHAESESAYTEQSTKEEISNYTKQLNESANLCETYKGIPQRIRNDVLKNIHRQEKQDPSRQPLFRKIAACHG